MPSTTENEFRSHYFERIKYANDNFSSHWRPGWLSDRGEVYIKLGKPTDIEKFPFRREGRDVDVWEYWSRGGLDLIFYDRTGLGDYELLNRADLTDYVY